MNVPLVIAVSETNGKLVPSVQPVPNVTVSPGETQITWSLTTDNPHDDKQATFGAPETNHLGIVLKDPLPHGAGLLDDGALTGSPTAWTIGIDNHSHGHSGVDVRYTIGYTFDGEGHTHDPVIVVTPEPINPIHPEGA